MKPIIILTDVAALICLCVIIYGAMILPLVLT